MKALTCEMCGSSNLVKQDGVFVCQSCGTKYSVEEAKKMMVEGTVRIDQSINVENLLKLANNALNSLNANEAYKYATKALEISPENGDAWFVRMKAVGNLFTLQDFKINDVLNAGNNVIQFKPELSNDVYEYYLSKMLGNLQFCMFQMNDTENIKQLYKVDCSLDPFHASRNTYNSDEILNLICLQRDLIIELRRAVPKALISSNKTISDLVCEIAKQWIDFTNSHNNRLNVYGYKLNDEAATWYRDILTEIKDGLSENKLREIDEASIEKESWSGCYIATAVYGSYNCPEVWVLRRFRDYTLAETWYGRAFIHTYYAISPTLVKWFGRTEWFRKIWKKPLDILIDKLQSYGIENTPYDDITL